jgi:hypothetical protein
MAVSTPGPGLHSRGFVVAAAVTGVVFLVVAAGGALFATFAFTTRNDPFFGSPGMGPAIIFGVFAVLYGGAGAVAMRVGWQAAAARRDSSSRPAPKKRVPDSTRDTRLVIAFLWLAALSMAGVIVVRAM